MWARSVSSAIFSELLDGEFVAKPIHYIDRESGTVCEETIYGRAALEFAYQTILGRTMLKVLPHGIVSSLYGWQQRLPSSKKKIPEFVRSLGIDVEEADCSLSDYASLDGFFTRCLKPEARPIEGDSKRFISPADGRTLVYQTLDNPSFSIKGAIVQLGDLLVDADLANRYHGGSAIVVRLAPCDYHRFHFPDDGKASSTTCVNGRLHSVHPIALESGAPSFSNARAICLLESTHFGEIVMIEVGAFAVGTIVQTYKPGDVSKGDEKGYFRFGGSTVVVLLRNGRLKFDDDLVDASSSGMETFVKMGTGLGTAVS